MGSAHEKWPALAKGLDQIPTKDLRRLEGELVDKKKPLLFTGEVFTASGRY
jgi:hypothetical protein